MNKVDLDKNGIVTLEEYKTAVGKDSKIIDHVRQIQLCTVSEDQLMNHTSSLIDKDQDGIISKTEISSYYSDHNE